MPPPNWTARSAWSSSSSRRDGLADNTVVVFFGDNGQAHVRGKQFCYDSGLHVPLIIRWPKAIRRRADFTPGTVSDRLLASHRSGRHHARHRRRAETRRACKAGSSSALEAEPPREYRLRRARPLRRDGVPLPHRPRRPLPLHPQLHARPPVPAAERLQGDAATRSGTCSSNSTPKANSHSGADNSWPPPPCPPRNSTTPPPIPTRPSTSPPRDQPGPPRRPAPPAQGRR